MTFPKWELQNIKIIGGKSVLADGVFLVLREKKIQERVIEMKFCVKKAANGDELGPSVPSAGKEDQTMRQNAPKLTVRHDSERGVMMRVQLRLGGQLARGGGGMGVLCTQI